MQNILDNPVYDALCTGDASFNKGNGEVKFFDEAVSPFAGFSEDNSCGFDDLHQLVANGRRILYATRANIDEPKGWQQVLKLKGLQFIYKHDEYEFDSSVQPVQLSKEHVAAMKQLADITKPGPFGERTIEFGHYHGIFEDGKLVSMTGQRLHPGNYTEISAVCTHPDHLGKGYAAVLLEHQLSLICSQNKIPFLHVREDNARAIALYERLGFTANGPMNFYLLQKKE